MPRYELLEHTADVAVRVRGADFGELYAGIVWAVVDLMADASAVAATVSCPIDLAAESPEELVVALANEILFHFETDRLLLPHLAPTSAGPTSVRGALRGEPLDPGRHLWKTELKSATYHDLAVRTDESGLVVDLVLDV